MCSLHIEIEVLAQVSLSAAARLRELRQARFVQA
jgi:hypothetical protein